MIEDLEVEDLVDAYRRAITARGLTEDEVDTQCPLFLETFRKELALAVTLQTLGELHKKKRVRKVNDTWQLVALVAA